MKKKFVYSIIGFGIFCLSLLITDTKVLVYESKGISQFDPTRFNPFDDKKEWKTLDCKYFTGRNFINRNISVSSRDTCPFLAKE